MRCSADTRSRHRSVDRDWPTIRRRRSPPRRGTRRRGACPATAATADEPSTAPVDGGVHLVLVDDGLDPAGVDVGVAEPATRHGPGRPSNRTVVVRRRGRRPWQASGSSSAWPVDRGAEVQRWPVLAESRHHRAARRPNRRRGRWAVYGRARRGRCPRPGGPARSGGRRPAGRRAAGGRATSRAARPAGARRAAARKPENAEVPTSGSRSRSGSSLPMATTCPSSKSARASIDDLPHRCGCRRRP